MKKNQPIDADHIKFHKSNYTAKIELLSLDLYLCKQ